MSDAINPQHYKRLPAEAIDIIESAIDNAPSNQDAYLHGQVLKYILRCWNKNGIEDLKKAKWYLDRLVGSLDEYEQQKASDLQSLKDHPFGKLKEPAIKQPLTPEPPNGWRWLEVGEVICKGDKPVKGDAIPLLWIGTPCCGEEFILRRNRFEVGEKVVHIDDKEPTPYDIDEYIYSKDAYILKYKDGHYMYHSSKLAPCIEDAT